MDITQKIDRQDAKTHTDRVYGLDVLRSFAVLFVLIGHSLEHSVISMPIQTLGHLGILGVELFFVLSGFLIGSIIMRQISANQFHTFQDISTFWKRRWLRTLPLYFVALLAFIRFDYHGRHGLLDYPAYFVFMQSFAYKIPEFFELSWSLAIEEHFYLWFPLAFLLWQKVTGRARLSIVLTAVTFVVIAYTYRLSQPLFTDWNDYNRAIRLPVLSRIDAIMFGVLMAAAKHYWSTAYDWIRRLTPLTAVLFVVLCVWWFINVPHLMQSRALQINLFTVQAVLCALLLPWFDGLRSSQNKNGFFTLTSKLSYSLYLVHILVIIFINQVLRRLGFFDAVYTNPFIVYPLYFSFYYLVAWFTYHQIEKPFILLRDMPLTWVNLARQSWVTVLIVLTLIIVF